MKNEKSIEELQEFYRQIRPADDFLHTHSYIIIRSREKNGSPIWVCEHCPKLVDSM